MIVMVTSDPTLWGSSFPSGPVDHQARRGKRQMGRPKALAAHTQMEATVRETDFGESAQFYSRVEAWGQIVIGIKWHTPVTRLSMWQQGL